MKGFFVGLVGALCIALAQPAIAEVLHGVEPLSSFGDVKKIFPKAHFEPTQAAWVKEHQALFRMSGVGFPGDLLLAFNDLRRYEKGAPSDLHDRSKQASGLERLDDDEALLIDWVRWVPSASIPVQRVKAMYGDPSKCDFNPADLTPICTWESRALSARMSDDGKEVLFFTARFTNAELRSAFKRKGLEIPSAVQD